MDRNEQKRREEELDRFWDIDALIPPRKIMPSASSNTDTVEILVEKEEKSTNSSGAQALPQRKNDPERYYVPPHKPIDAASVKVPDEEYTPQGSLIHTVRIFKQKTNYQYYEAFAADAVRLYAVHGVECAHIPFFSYVPQYSQMNRQQLEWYLWWRENFRNGTALATDYSYLLLYAYEVINLKELMDPSEGQNMLCRLWLSYRELFHQLDTYLPEWICDYSLLHRLTPPADLAPKELSAAMSHCALKEFYVASDEGDSLVRGLLIFGSNYDYHKSKFYVPELKKLFDVTVLGAMTAVFDGTGGREGSLFQFGTPESTRLVRDAYTGALCASTVKRKIAVEYTSLSCTHSLRLLITDIIKYTENRIRGHIGVRARLGIYALPTNIRAILDEYLKPLQTNQRSAAAQKKKEEEQVYERLYDLPKTALSLENASKIEQTSWSTTERLVEAFAEEESAAPMPVPSVADKPTPTESAPAEEKDADVPGSPLTPYFDFIEAAVQADGLAQKQIALQKGQLIDAIADRINELAAEQMGDVLLEERDGIYCVLEDYLEWAIELMLQGKDDEDGK